jgi:hypothetical protein
MTDHRSLPPEAEACLCRRYSSSQKGGTLIAAEVTSLEEHERRLQAPDLYRPEGCGRCGGQLHLHDYRSRQLRADPAGSTEVVRFRCADRDACGATWQVLPALMARHLWRSWRVVEAVVLADEGEPVPPVPERTERRWRSRLRASAAMLVSVLTTASVALYDAIIRAVGLRGSRARFIAVYSEVIGPGRTQRLAHPAELIHRLEPGVRLM